MPEAAWQTGFRAIPMISSQFYNLYRSSYYKLSVRKQSRKASGNLSHLQQCLTGFADFITLYAASFLAESLKAQLLLSPHQPSEFFFFFVPLFYWTWPVSQSCQSAWNPMFKKSFLKNKEECKVFLSSLSSSKQSLYLLAASCHSVFSEFIGRLLAEWIRHQPD